MFLVTDSLHGPGWAAVCGGAAVLTAALVWWAVPIRRRLADAAA